MLNQGFGVDVTLLAGELSDLALVPNAGACNLSHFRVKTMSAGILRTPFEHQMARAVSESACLVSLFEKLLIEKHGPTFILDVIANKSNLAGEINHVVLVEALVSCMILDCVAVVVSIY